MKLNLIISLFFVLLITLIATNCQSNPYQQGEVLYSNFCESCHMEDGSGLEGNIPPLAQSDYLKNNQHMIACIIRNGQQDSILVNGLVYNYAMPAVAQLSDFEITNVINYINHAWGNDYGYMQIDEVRAGLEQCPTTSSRLKELLD